MFVKGTIEMLTGSFAFLAQKNAVVSPLKSPVPLCDGFDQRLGLGVPHLLAFVFGVASREV